MERRLDGLDAARALALAGMLLSHFARGGGRADPGWLQGIDGAADGRAAPLFCVLLGVGAGILVSRSRSDSALVRRGLALAAVGLAVWPHVQDVYLILPHYGLLLACVPLLRRLPTSLLLPAAFVAFLVPSVVTALVDDHRMRAAPQPDAYGDLVDVWFLVRHIGWTGGYPVVGWVGFVLVGLWVARLPLRRRAVQRWLAAGGAAVGALQPVASWLLTEDVAAPFVDGSAHSNRTAWYVLSSATAVAAIGACLLVARFPRPVLRLGRMMLSAYLLHIAFGALVVWDRLERSQPPLTTQVAVAAATFLALAVLADLWGRRFERGPLESGLRAVAP